MTKQKRRDFLKLTALSAGFLGLTSATSYSKDLIEDKLNALTQPRKAQGKSVMGLRTDPIEQVKVAFIGVGSRGSGHVNRINALYPKAKITAICDIRESRTDKVMESLKDTKQKPAVYSGKEDAWKEMVKRDDIDLVIVSTPWEDHAPMCIYSMQQG
ncbi:MAG TPA: acetylgalactosaminidase, partial [Desulfobacteraceae bacterium]|nr:acetylgalactosaminidase [Desulfobacteraceae bacterium]